jgi:hypothetical protein
MLEVAERAFKSHPLIDPYTPAHFTSSFFFFAEPKKKQKKKQKTIDVSLPTMVMIAG